VHAGCRALCYPNGTPRSYSVLSESAYGWQSRCAPSLARSGEGNGFRQMGAWCNGVTHAQHAGTLGSIPVCPLWGAMSRPCGWPRGRNNEIRCACAWALWSIMFRGSSATCVVVARSMDGGMCKISVGDMVVASCRLQAPSQPVEHHGTVVHNARCVDAPLAQWLERWSHEA
jgi:hypothetical protein